MLSVFDIKDAIKQQKKYYKNIATKNKYLTNEKIAVLTRLKGIVEIMAGDIKEGKIKSQAITNQIKLLKGRNFNINITSDFFKDFRIDTTKILKSKHPERYILNMLKINIEDAMESEKTTEKQYAQLEVFLRKVLSNIAASYETGIIESQDLVLIEFAETVIHVFFASSK